MGWGAISNTPSNVNDCSIKKKKSPQYQAKSLTTLCASNLTQILKMIKKIPPIQRNSSSMKKEDEGLVLNQATAKQT